MSRTRFILNNKQQEFLKFWLDEDDTLKAAERFVELMELEGVNPQNFSDCLKKVMEGVLNDR
jgi:uncharacterized protein Yka (UPF0111/DUF47 family)